MITDFHFVRAAATRIGEAADATSQALGEGLVKTDASFTDRWVRQAAKAVDGFQHQGMRWRARAHIATGGGDAPAIDLVCAVEVDLPGYSSRNGFVAQTFLIDEDHPPDSSQLHTLRKRCKAIQTSTPASFVLVYRARDVIVVPAAAVLATSTRPDRLHKRKIGHFFEEFFSSFIGDGRIAGAKSGPLEELVRQKNARAGLALHVELVTTPRQESLFRR